MVTPNKAANSSGPEQPLPQGSLPAGIAGALTGSLLGAVPYGVMLVYLRPNVHTSEVWEALGLLIGYCGCLGYRGFKGRRSTAAAFVIVALAGLLVMLAANLLAEVYALRPDLFAAAVKGLLAPERRLSVLCGLLFGAVGIWSARSYLLWYTNPVKAARKYAEAAWKRPALETDLPRSFTVRYGSRREIWVGGLCAGLFTGLLFLSLLAFDPAREREWLLLSVCLYPAGIAGGVYMALCCRNFRLEIDGSYLRYVSAFGREREFYAGDIYGLERSLLTGYYQLYDREGWRLGWFDPAQENGPALVQYLRNYGIGMG